MSQQAIVGGYSLHLYCQCPVCIGEGWRRQYNGGFREFYGTDKRSAFREAGMTGWKVSEKRGYALAPGHSPKPLRAITQQSHS